MRKIPGLLILVAGIGLLVYALNRPWGQVPALGKLFSPVTGLWQNAETGSPVSWGEVPMAGLRAPVRIQYDARLVPHIFAQNEHDVYFAQGFVTAQLRLFQMDFQTRAAAGRLSEVLGPLTLNVDLQARRLGLLFSAERAIEAMQQDTATLRAVEAYTAGINAYIDGLAPKDYPLEYKLLGFEPEEWTPLRSALLLKQMSLTLSFEGSDFRMSQVLTVLGRTRAEFLFPNYGPLQEPIIPADTQFGVDLPVPKEIPDSLDLTAQQSAYTRGGWKLPEAHPDVGSNNWVIAAEKSATGYPILANDPHLGLTLPSLWMEAHLITPTQNVYGVSLPGSPGIIVGFNQNIAWGVTNVGADVVDWYQIEFVDTLTYEKYRYDGAERLTTTRVEVIYVKGAPARVDTLRFTHHGPLPYLNVRYHPQRYQAVRWLTHDPSNELRTFLELNHASDYEEYVRALSYFSCPAQNFVYADNQKNIALWVNGRFPAKAPGQGKYVSAGNTSATEWQGWIPHAHNPHALNPPQGFLGSANQQSAGPDYPYYFDWDQETWQRGARIHQRLRSLKNAVPDSLRAIQNDNFGLLAQRLLPVLLDSLPAAVRTGTFRFALDTLAGWDYQYERWAVAPTIFETWQQILYQSVWKDELDSLPHPNAEVTTYLLTTGQTHPWVDDLRTPEVETLSSLSARAFQQALDSLTRTLGPIGPAWVWATYKNTHVRYLLPLPPFSRFGHTELPIGGGRGIVNNARGNHGPSWRVVVALGAQGPTAFGIYPGGQSGNPGSRYYDNFLDTWAAGKLAPLLFLQAPLEKGSDLLGEQQLSPAGN